MNADMRDGKRRMCYLVTSSAVGCDRLDWYKTNGEHNVDYHSTCCAAVIPALQRGEGHLIPSMIVPLNVRRLDLSTYLVYIMLQPGSMTKSPDNYKY